MHRRGLGWALVALALVSLGACTRSVSPRDAIAVAVRIEKVRAHLSAAAALAATGDWALAAAHAGHPAEDMQAIDAALSSVDPQADAALRAELIAIRDAVAAKSGDVATLVIDADRTLAAAERAIGQGAADTGAFRAAVASDLLELATTEYDEGVANGSVQQLSEYEDAYVFLARAHALVPALDPSLLAAIPSLVPPAALVAPDRVEALVDAAKDALAPIAGTTYAPAPADDLAPLLATIDTAAAHVDRGDASAANAAVLAFRGSWTQVEGQVKARSADAYARIENDFAAATAALVARPPSYGAAREAIADMRAQLAPFVATAASYTAFDAGLILVREGVEALLIIAALLAFLAKTGNAAKRRWIWTGGAAGIAASIAIAGLITVAFSASEAAGADRELLEGGTGLFAAAMLVYMSWWLHSKASLSSWQRYIREKSGAALANGSLLGLALVAFLAVFREGAETALFYVGMAPAIGLSDLALGLGVGALVLAAVGAAVLAFGARIPVRPFFLGTSVLVYYLALKFAGTGIHALQVAGILSASPRAYLPDVGLIGAFPTLETTVVQAALVLGAAGWLVTRRRFDIVARDPRTMGSEPTGRRRET